jgi:hypothetical protein
MAKPCRGQAKPLWGLGSLAASNQRGGCVLGPKWRSTNVHELHVFDRSVEHFNGRHGVPLLICPVNLNPQPGTCDAEHRHDQEQRGQRELRPSPLRLQHAHELGKGLGHAISLAGVPGKISLIRLNHYRLGTDFPPGGISGYNGRAVQRATFAACGYSALSPTGLPMIEFVMTYPCFVPLHQPGVAVTLTAEGDDCVPIFTDDDLLRRFFESSTRPGAVLVRAEFADAAALVRFLRQFEGCELGPRRVVTHVIIDPIAGRARVHSIGEFVAHLEQTE